MPHESEQRRQARWMARGIIRERRSKETPRLRKRARRGPRSPYVQYRCELRLRPEQIELVEALCAAHPALSRGGVFRAALDLLLERYGRPEED